MSNRRATNLSRFHALAKLRKTAAPFRENAVAQLWRRNASLRALAKLRKTFPTNSKAVSWRCEATATRPNSLHQTLTRSSSIAAASSVWLSRSCLQPSAAESMTLLLIQLLLSVNKNLNGSFPVRKPKIMEYTYPTKGSKCQSSIDTAPISHLRDHWWLTRVGHLVHSS